MQVHRFEVLGPLELVPKRHADDRGHFVETFNVASAEHAGVVEREWVQDNQSLSISIYTLRGLHFQIAPFAQAKIVRVLRGSIYDVAVDLRAGSSTFGKWLGVTLDATKMNQLYIPKGFAHGFLTLENNVEVAYKVSERYSKGHDRCLNWADAEVGIAWPMPKGTMPQLSEKDRAAPKLRELMVEL